MTAAPDRVPRLGDRFEVHERLGVGAFGAVYRAHDRRYGADVALKHLVAEGPANLRTFKREFRAMAHLSHPNLVSLYELHEVEGAWFFTMELVRGVSLDQWIDLDRTGDLRAIFAQLATATATLHRVGLLHGDLKPSNAFLTPEGQVLVGDFGMVRPTEPDAAPRSRSFGTIAYAAPELFDDHSAGPSADWYSLGAMLYEALVGEPPATGETLLQIVAARTLRDGPHPREHGVTGELADLAAAMMRRDPSARPTTAAILRALGAEEPGQSRAPRVFVGRGDELARLEELYAERDRPRSVWIEGPSGIGKSTLASRFARDRRQEGALVLEARCHPSDGLAGRAVDELVDGLAEHLERLEPTLCAELTAPADPALGRMYPALRSVLPRSGPATRSDPAQRRAALLSLSRLLDAVAERTPLVLFVDDLQWADAGSGTDLGAVLATMRAPVLALATLRSDHLDAPAPRALQRAQRHEPARLQLGPLATSAVAELLRAEGAEAGAAAEVARVSAGNPYLVRELAELDRGGRESGVVSRDWRARIIGRRERALGPAGRRMLRAVALAHGPLSPAVLIDACELSEGEYLAELGTLRAQRLATARLTRAAESVEPYHSWVREAVAETLPEPEALGVHRRLGLALERSPEADPGTIAQHLFAGGEPERARPHAVRAARAATEALAFGRAADLFQLALDCAPSGEERLALSSGRAEALTNAGRSHDAARAFDELAELDAEGRALQHQRRAAEQLLYGGAIDRGIARMRRVLARVGIRYPTSKVLSIVRVVAAQAFGPTRKMGPEIARSLRRRPQLDERVDTLHAATLGLSMTDPLPSARLQVDHVREAIACGDPGRLARALCIHAVQTAGGFYDPERTRRILATIDALVTEQASPRIEAEVAMTRAGVAWMEGRLSDAVEWADRTGELLRTEACVGMPWHQDTRRILLLDALESLERTERAERLYTAALTDARERGDRFLEASLLVRWGVTRELREGDPAAAAAALRAAERIWARDDIDPITLQAAIGRARILVMHGEHDAAREWVEQTNRRMTRSLLWRAFFYRDRWAIAHAEILSAWLAAGRGSPKERLEVRKQLEAMLTRLQETGVPVAVAAVRRLRA